MKIGSDFVLYLSKIHIENFRLLKNVDITFDRNLTLFVGKNNTGKTSVMDVVTLVLSDRNYLAFDDYPLTARQSLYTAVLDYWQNQDLDTFQKSVFTTSIMFTIDYSDGEIGNADAFVIDLDEKINYAVVRVSFDTTPNVAELLDYCQHQYNMLIPTNPSEDDKNNCLMRVVRKNFSDFFAINIVAVNPTDTEDFLVKKRADLQNLFNLKLIRAERDMDESDSANRNPIGQIMKRLFGTELSNIDNKLQPSMEALHRIVDDANFNLQNQINTHMDRIVANMMTFGYPSGENMQLRANTSLALERQLIDDTKLTYSSKFTDEALPESHNGLGYKNLIKITMELHEYARSLKEDYTKIPLLFIEEPEAHMHPQLQTVFVTFLNSFLAKEVGENRVQTIITSHSAHIANAVPFKQVRYMHRCLSMVECKSMEDFPTTAKTENEKVKRLDFLQKYMKLSYCDLYFCDKAILVEGASEKLLLPNMMEKCRKAGEFDGVPIPLTNQYYTIVEVGGAYVHHFFDIVDYLEIPTLIITDIDFVGSDRKRCQKDMAVRSSNAAINAWCYRQYQITGTVSLEQVNELASDATKRTEKLRHLEFQKEENGFHPRSLEEAIINCNRSMFGKSATEMLDFMDEGEKKTDFALKLLTDSSYIDYQIPLYIRDGLVWLNCQSRGGQP
jgi:predicted ATP-dependent endonuclease of OLD family